VTRSASSPVNSSVGSTIKDGAQILLRSELFEHGLYPMQSKLSNLSLVNTFSNLNLLSSLDYKIKLAAWVDQAKRHIPDMTESDAHVYFATYRALLDDIDN
jgi:hypothetical protein